MLDPYNWLWRTILAAMAAEGLEDVAGLPLIIGVAGLLAAIVVEFALGDWFRRHPLGSHRRVGVLVLLRLSLPLVWTLAAVGVVVG
jgi:hypothetical protein